MSTRSRRRRPNGRRTWRLSFKRLRRENEILRQEREILKRAAGRGLSVEDRRYVGLIVGLRAGWSYIANKINQLHCELAETEGFEPSIGLYNPIAV